MYSVRPPQQKTESPPSNFSGVFSEGEDCDGLEKVPVNYESWYAIGEHALLKQSTWVK